MPGSSIVRRRRKSFNRAIELCASPLRGKVEGKIMKDEVKAALATVHLPRRAGHKPFLSR
jgi:hypothetical protein